MLRISWQLFLVVWCSRIATAVLVIPSAPSNYYLLLCLVFCFTSSRMCIGCKKFCCQLQRVRHCRFVVGNKSLLNLIIQHHLVQVLDKWASLLLQVPACCTAKQLRPSSYDQDQAWNGGWNVFGVRCHMILMVVEQSNDCCTAAVVLTCLARTPWWQTK